MTGDAIGYAAELYGTADAVMFDRRLGTQTCAPDHPQNMRSIAVELNFTQFGREQTTELIFNELRQCDMLFTRLSNPLPTIHG